MANIEIPLPESLKAKRRIKKLHLEPHELLKMALEDTDNLEPEERFTLGFSLLQGALLDATDSAEREGLLHPAIELTSRALTDIISHPQIPSQVKFHLGKVIVAEILGQGEVSNVLQELQMLGFTAMETGIKELQGS